MSLPLLSQYLNPRMGHTYSIHVNTPCISPKKIKRKLAKVAKTFLNFSEKVCTLYLTPEMTTKNFIN